MIDWINLWSRQYTRFSLPSTGLIEGSRLEVLIAGAFFGSSIKTNHHMKNLSLSFILSLFFQFSFAQYQIGLVPRTSPDAQVYKIVGFTEITLSYGSPSVNEREIWGELVPYGKVWRTGANSSTKISFDADVDL